MDYSDKQHFFEQMITVYGRNPVLEVLRDNSLPVYRLHFAESNRRNSKLDEMSTLAHQRGIDVQHHSRDKLSRISKNKRQDQGVAIDIQCPSHNNYRTFLENALEHKKTFQLIALDRVTNPQNLGMIIRSVCASPVDGLLLPNKGSAPLSPLVIKASAGTLFRCPLLRCEQLSKALEDFSNEGVDIVTLVASADTSIANYQPSGSVIYVLGNETEGVSAEVLAAANAKVSIPMAKQVESLNVAVIAGLIAFRGVISPHAKGD